MIKFIDPTTKMFKLVKFSETSIEGIYMPDNIKCLKFQEFISQQMNAKFLPRVLFLMTLELKELI